MYIQRVTYTTVNKCRFFNNAIGIQNSSIGSHFFVNDSLIDGNSVSASKGINLGHNTEMRISESEFKNNTTGDIIYVSSIAGAFGHLRIVILSSATEIDIHNLISSGGIFSEDHDGMIGDARQFTGFSTAEGTPIIQSDTGTVRSGGGDTSIKVIPSTDISTAYDLSRIKLFEYPIYADTSSKQYDVYFNSTNTANWTNDPTNSELWIECEYWGHVTNNHRKIKKSTGVIDFNGSTSWQALSVTCQPSQTGILYLKGYYAKTKEAEYNVFFVDIAPVIQ